MTDMDELTACIKCKHMRKIERRTRVSFECTGTPRPQVFDPVIGKMLPWTKSPPCSIINDGNCQYYCKKKEGA